LWRDSLRFAARHWALGAGPETFSALFPQFQSEDLARAYPDFYYESPHNLFLDALTAQGIFGLAVVVGLIGLGLWVGPVALRAGLVAAVVAHCFMVLILPTAMYFYLFVALGVAVRSEPVPMARRWALVPVAAAMIFLAVRLLVADRSLELARVDMEAGRTMDAMAHYRAGRERGLAADVWYARSLASLAPFEAMAAAQRATSSEDAQNAYYTLAWLYARAGDVSHTEQSLRAAVRCAPNWFKPHWMLAQILQREGRGEEARLEAERAAYLNAGKNPEVGATVPNR
jgi:tetratricopeptide (TPR) repeat protein